jgi:acetyltransferase-like isoleucine patch superfamily enzyme
MQLAVFENFLAIKEIFKPYQKTIFPHIRQDYMQRKIQNGNVIFMNGVVIIFGIYQKKQRIGDHAAIKNHAYISQIVSNKGNGSKILQEFFRFIKVPVWLTVRSDNLKARQFYEKNGMILIDNISWKKGTIAGCVYFYKNEQNSDF